MPYDDPYRRTRSDVPRQGNNRRADGRSRSAGYSGSQRSRTSGAGRGQRPQQGRNGSRGRSNSASRPRRTNQVRELNLGARPQTFSQRLRRLEPRAIVLLVAIVVLVVVAVFLVSSCVSSCSTQKEEEKVNQLDARVSADVSDDVTNKFSPTLDRNEKFAWIAQNASRYPDTTLIDLAVAQPDAIDFVASYPDSDKAAQDYGDSVTKGRIPELYCWDSRWGGVDYDGHPLAVTGSGPTAVAMAYMGLTGRADQTPATIAQMAASGGFNGGESHLSPDFVAQKLTDLGLEVQDYTSSDSNVTSVLDAGTYLLVEAKAGTLGDDSAAHWVVAYTENENGTVQVFDPTDPSAATHQWSSATIASACDTFYAVKEGTQPEEADDSASSTATTTTTE